MEVEITESEPEKPPAVEPPEEGGQLEAAALVNLGRELGESNARLEILSQGQTQLLTEVGSLRESVTYLQSRVAVMEEENLEEEIEESEEEQPEVEEIEIPLPNEETPPEPRKAKGLAHRLMFG